jgi:Protein of unknown function (DUF2996)
MTEEITNPTPVESATPKAKKEKPPALEDKPFTEFIEQHFLSSLEKALLEKGINDLKLSFVKEKFPILGVISEECWQIKGNWDNNKKQFNLYFPDENISGAKAFSCATNGGKPSDIESFMIDEKKVTLDLMVLYTLQRLRAQKWLTRN